MTPTIRRLGPAEQPILRRIWLEALTREPAAFASSLADYQTAPPEAWVRDDRDPVFVAFAGDDPLGITALFQSRPARTVHRGRIGMVYVRAPHRGTGLAGRLLDAVTDHARTAGITQLELTCSAENPAAFAFYRRHGYREVGRIPRGFIDAGHAIDDILMLRLLEAA